MPEYGSIDHVTFPNINTYSKLCIICKALNNNEVPINGTMYYPRFSIITDGGKLDCYLKWIELGNNKYFCFSDVYNDDYDLIVNPKLTLKTKSLAEFCGTQFIEIWKDYMLSNVKLD